MVLTDTRPGLWSTLIGVVVLVLAPMFGFLVGSSIGPGEPGDGLGPLYWGLFVGVLIGGCGGLLALAGGWRMWRDQTAANAEAEAAASSGRHSRHQ